MDWTSCDQKGFLFTIYHFRLRAAFYQYIMHFNAFHFIRKQTCSMSKTKPNVKPLNLNWMLSDSSWSSYVSRSTKKHHHSPQEECLASGAKFKCLRLQSHPNRPTREISGRFSVPRSPAWSKSTKESARTSTMCRGNWDPVGFYRYERFLPNCSLSVEG